VVSKPSLFGTLDDAPALVSDAAKRTAQGGPSAWLAARGSEGFGEFERQVSDLRVNGGNHLPAHTLADDARTFVRKWLAHRHPQRGAAGAMPGDWLVAVNDAARIWATNLLTHAEALAGQSRSRLNLVQTDKAGGALTVSHVALSDSPAEAELAAALHVYCVDVRERTSASLDTAMALQAQCDLLVEIIGPMTVESLQNVTDRVRRTLQAPGQSLLGALFVLSASASSLREPLEQFGTEMGDRVMATQVNLSDTGAVWAEVLGALEVLAAPQAHQGQTDAATNPGPAPADETSLPTVLRAMAQTEGTQWVALVGRDPAVHLIETADGSDAGYDAALSMAVLLSAEAAEAGTQVKVETGQTFTLARTLAHTQLGVAARFVRSEVPEPVANLLIARMCEELDALGASA
jgi:hypothetical protein